MCMRFPIHCIWACVAAWALPAMVIAQPQDQPAEPFSDLVEVSEVLLDVLATDENGNVVRGLDAQDFIVEEDGQPVPVTSVSFYATRYGETDTASQDVPSSRYFIAFFHDQTRHGYFGSNLIRQQLEAGRQAARWVRESMLGSDWMAVVSYDMKLHVHQDFTQDREALEKAIARATTGKGTDAADVWPSRQQRRAGTHDLAVLSRLATGRELRQGSRNIYEALRLVAEATGYLVGRKNLLLFTVGFGRRIGATGFSRPDPRYYAELEAELNDHNVATYPIDITPAGRTPLYSDVLGQLAEDTGGTYFEDFVGFMSPLEDISDENYGYYLLSYQTMHAAGEIGYQRVEVKARDDKIRVHARTGYRYGI